MTRAAETLIAKADVDVEASASRVWDVLVLARHIKEWDDVPEGFTADRLRLGSVLEWPGHARLTVTELEPCKRLKMILVATKWQPPIPDDIGYAYSLSEKQGLTTLTITVGDFGQLPDGKDYYDASVEFVQAASKKIKELSES